MSTATIPDTLHYLNGSTVREVAFVELDEARPNHAIVLVDGRRTIVHTRTLYLDRANADAAAQAWLDRDPAEVAAMCRAMGYGLGRYTGD